MLRIADAVSINPVVVLLINVLKVEEVSARSERTATSLALILLLNAAAVSTNAQRIAEAVSIKPLVVEEIKPRKVAEVSARFAFEA